MNTIKFNPGVRALVVAIQTAVLAMGAVATVRADEGDDPARLLTQPTNYVEIGAGYVSDDSYKFGEYNGLYDQGVFGILNLLYSGGGTYNSDNAVRWRVVANNLGLRTRDVSVEYGEQGRYRIDAKFDSLRKSRSDSYQTPYLGAGTNNLTLPGTWIKPVVPQSNANNLNFRSLLPASSQTPVLAGGVLVQPTPAQLAQMNAIIAADVPAFHNVNLATKRESEEVGFSYQISPQWDIKLSAKNENKDGLKAMSTVTSLVREFAAIIPDLVDQNTQQYNVNLNYTGDTSYMRVGYYGSIYDNNVKSMTWQDVSDPSRTSTTSTAPSNEYHQFNVVGGYNFSRQTKLVVNASYARTTQDSAYVDDPLRPLALPVSSLDGLVVTKSFDAKLTSHPTSDLNLSLAYKYDDHNNKTDIHTYFFYDANEARSGNASAFNAALGLAPNTLGSNINIYANRPYSKRLNQIDASADYAIADGQTIKGVYQYQQYERDCTGSWINCSDAPKTKENLGQLEWRNSAIENVTTSVSYTRSYRSAKYDENAFLALVPMANVIPAGGATMSVYDYLLATGLTGFGPSAGFPTTPLTGDAAIFSPNNNIVPQALYGSRNNINELLGLRRYNMADRDLDKLRARFDWQASDEMNVVGSVAYTRNDYKHSLYGLTDDKTWAFNLDGSYSISENASADLFYTYEEGNTKSASRAYGSNSNTAFVGVAANTVVDGGCFATVQARSNNNKIDACQDWSTNSADKVHTAGIAFNYKGLMGGKLNLNSELVGTRARTKVHINGGSYVNNPLAAAGQPPVTPAVFFIPAADMPTVVTNTVELKFNARWKLGQSSDIVAFYWFSHLKASDYYYDGLQFGSLSIVTPTNEKPPSYNVHVIGLTYNYRWQ